MMRSATVLRFWLGCLLWTATQSPVLAHGGKAEGAAARSPGPQSWNELWRAWPLEPFILLPLIVSAWLYIRGINRLWRDAGRGRGVRVWEAACFAGGWLALAVALVSPLHPWGNALFSVHMVQHEILMLAAAPLLVLGQPVIATLKALPPGTAQQVVQWTKPWWIQRVWDAITRPLAAWLIHAVVLWTWHVPALFHAALGSEFVHALQHLSFLFSALLFWWAVVRGRKHAIAYGAAVLYMFTTAVHNGLLGALITLATRVWYPDYLETTTAWGLTPLQDQQLGGLIMWIPACSIYIPAGLVLFAAWLRSSEDRVRRWEARAGAPSRGPGREGVRPEAPSS